MAGMCSGDYWSAGIDETNGGFTLSSTTLAHEMGHNFGMEHDGDGNACSSSG